MGFLDVIKDRLIAFFDNRFTKKTQFVSDPHLLAEEYEVNPLDTPKTAAENLINFAYLSMDDIYQKLDSSIYGLNSEAVLLKQHKYGINQIEEDKRLPWYIHLFICYKNPFNLLLTFLSIVTYLTDDARGTVVIVSMILLSTFLRFIQELRSNSAADSLKAMVSTTVSVFRNKEDEELDSNLSNYASINKISLFKFTNHSIEVPLRDLVPGDIIKLSAGDLVPADVRIIQSKDLFVSQATLTGESLPIEKFNELSQNGITQILELSNIGFMGTNVVSGTAIAIVLTTGKNTIFGQLAHQVVTKKPIETSFQKGIERVSWLLIYFMLIMAPIVFLLNGFTKHDWLSASLFALAVAVGLTPEMLPMIVTSTLAKGAVMMSRRKVVVKRLDAIQNFGAMDILCTDKTGTLTQDKICLEKHIDIHGKQCDEVLEYAYLNSYYQTGLKNLLDVAVLEHHNYGNIPNLVKSYKIIDEVPFDFTRRRMSVVVANNHNEHILICKGAVEEILDCCSGASHRNEHVLLSDDLLKELKRVVANLNVDGLRVVAVAIKRYPNYDNDFLKTYSISDEKDLTLIGYIAFMDPPKETTKPALLALKKHGINVKILTGDNELITKKVCRDVGLEIKGVILGAQIDDLSDKDLVKIARDTTIFAKLTPQHKERIVEVLHNSGHVVGFMGDGINDAPALRSADIGISVDTAVDIAKEAADIILLEKSLLVLEQGVEEGRKTFANMLKYIKITASSNFGNVFSVLIASVFLPFEPMLPLHLLVVNFLYDISQVVIPFDNVDKEFILKPQKFDSKELRRFMIYFGPISSIFDILTFIVLWYVVGANSVQNANLFQSGWFVESLFTQTLVVHMIRTKKIPFIQSIASPSMIIMLIVILLIGFLLPMVPELASQMKMTPLPNNYFIYLLFIVSGYVITVQFFKNIYYKFISKNW